MRSLALSLMLAIATCTAALAVDETNVGTVTPKQAIQAMTKAGYWGIGGVTRNDPFYFAAAMSPDKKRVRVAVDVKSGAVVNVTPLARGAGALTPTASSAAALSYQPPRIEATGVVQTRDPYVGQVPTRVIGRRYSPWNSAGNAPAPLNCRYSAYAPGC